MKNISANGRSSTNRSGAANFRRNQMPKTDSTAEHAIENDKLHLVSAVEADHAERDQEHPQANERLLASAATTRDEDVWRGDNPDMVIPSQPAIQMYFNDHRQVVIRQEAAWNDDEDSYVFLAIENIDRFIAKLQQLKAEV
jgi:hypothetical protein